jgi:hypothetical protein
MRLLVLLITVFLGCVRPSDCPTVVTVHRCGGGGGCAEHKCRVTLSNGLRVDTRDPITVGDHVCWYHLK